MTRQYPKARSRLRVAVFAALASLALGCTTDNSPRPPSSDESRPSTFDFEPVGADPELRVANLGTCALESGELIRDCRVAYRTFGVLNADRSNAVLWPTWFTGKSKDLTSLVPDRFVDTTRFYLVLVDALGNGESSAPSNSPTQARLRFPKFTVRDMVQSQHRLLTETLGIHHLHAVAGISMGGMQAIEWSVTYPEFMDKIVSMVGSPRLTSQDMLLWTAELRALDNDMAYRNGNYRGHPILRTVVDVQSLALFTPVYRTKNTSREDFAAWLAKEEESATFDWNDWHRQLEAMMVHDVGAPYGSLSAAAKRVRAESLYMVSAHDQVVNPQPAQDFGVEAGAIVEVSSSECGHLAVQVCETDQAAARVSSFLAQ